MIFSYFKTTLSISVLVLLFSCSKTSGTVDPDPPVVPEEPNQTAELSFGGWERKAFVSPQFEEASAVSKAKTATVTINFSKHINKVSKYIYGDNANPYTGWMNENSGLMQNMANRKMGVLRGPGGSLSDVYFWDKGPTDVVAGTPATLYNSSNSDWKWYGIRPASWGKWSMGIDQFYDILRQTNATGMITVNYGYARYGTSPDPVATAAHYAANWVRYDNGKTKFWEIGNECFGSWEAGYEIDQTQNKDGQPKQITGELYGKHCLVFIDSMKKAAREIGKEIFIGVVTAEAAETSAGWNNGLLAQVGNKADFYAIHSYFTPYNSPSSAEVILKSPEKISAFRKFVNDGLTAAGKPVKPIALTEWNIFATGNMRAVSFINAMHATLILGELIKNGVEVASRWDLANGWSNGDDHGMFSYNGDNNEPTEPGGIQKYAPRPAFYTMYYFQKCFGDMMVESSSSNTNIVAYASKFSGGEAGIVLVNRGRTEQVAELELTNFTPGSRFYAYTLNGGTDNGDFSRKIFVNGVTSENAAGGPANYSAIKSKSTKIEGKIKIELPKFSIVHIMIEKSK